MTSSSWTLSVTTELRHVVVEKEESGAIVFISKDMEEHPLIFSHSNPRVALVVLNSELECHYYLELEK